MTEMAVLPPYHCAELEDLIVTHRSDINELVWDIEDRGYDWVAANGAAPDTTLHSSGLYVPQGLSVPRGLEVPRGAQTAEPKIYRALDPNNQVQTLEKVAGLVKEAGLEHMEPGFLGYMAVSVNMYKAIAEGRFEDYKKLLIEVPIFIGLAYDGLLKHMYGQKDQIASQWQSPMYSWLARHSSPGAGMWHFWRGHIPDLVKVLLLTGTVPDVHRDDYFNVDDVLYGAIPNVMEAIEMTQTRVTMFGAKIAMRDVCMLRAEQWQGFEEKYEAYGRKVPIQEVHESVIPGKVSLDTIRKVAQGVGDTALRTYVAAATLLPPVKQAA